MENSIYYTFSTIPQVLGSVVALLAVFFMYKIQIINAELRGFGEAVLFELEHHLTKVTRINKYLPSRLQKAISRYDLKEIKI